MTTTAISHTPGPWSIEVADVVSPTTGDVIAQVIGGEGTRYLDDDVNAECVANARLIAAAPDGHDILLAINEFFRHHNPVDPSATVLADDRTLKQAVADYIAKSTGR